MPDQCSRIFSHIFSLASLWPRLPPLHSLQGGCALIGQRQHIGKWLYSPLGPDLVSQTIKLSCALLHQSLHIILSQYNYYHEDFLIIFDVFCYFLFIVKTFVADVAHKICFTLNKFHLEIVFYIFKITPLAFIIIYTDFRIPFFRL